MQERAPPLYRSKFVNDHVVMADRRSEFDKLDPAVQNRIRRTLKIAGVWFGLVLVSAGVAVLCKPYLDKRRRAREQQPDFVRTVTPKQLRITTKTERK